MPDHVADYLIREALLATQAPALPAQARRWVETRVRRHGYDPALHNVGGVLCAYPHRHGEDDRCAVIDGRALRRFADVKQGAGVLVATALRAAARPDKPLPDLPTTLDGFRSTHPELGVAGVWDQLFGPSEDAERRFRELAADWESFERAGVTDPIADRRLKHLAADVRAWRAFRDAWQGGTVGADGAALSAQEINANRVRWELRDLAPQDPKWGKDKNLKGGDIEDATAALSAAAAIDKASRSVERTTAEFWADIPWQIKAGGAAFLGLYVLALVRDITRSVGR
jgi:hypothetical protein